MKAIILALALLTGCGSAASPPPPRPALEALLAEKKFQPDIYYTGVDVPEDERPLVDAVNEAINDVRALPEPLDKEAVRDRLSDLIDDTDLFATEDRDQVYRYAVRVWRAAGFTEESQLLAVPDDQVLAQP